MDPATLAASVAALLAPYVKKAGEEFVGEAGRFVQQKAGQLWQKLRTKLDADPRTKAVLDAFETDPDAGSEAFQTTVEETLTTDKPLADELSADVAEIKRRAPGIWVVQRMDEAESVVGLKAGRMKSGTVAVEQDIKKGTNVTGVEIDEIG